MSYDRFERWLASFRPEILENLQPPASDAELASLQERIGVSLPESFIGLYRWKNGQRDIQQMGPFYGLGFLSIADLLEQWETWKDDVRENPELNESAYNSSAVPGVVKALYSNPLWLPFAYDGVGNHIGVDLDPGPNGRVGQVINFGCDEEVKYVLGQTVDDFIQRIVKELERGNFILSNDYGDDGFETRNPPSGYFLDAARTWFGAA